VRKERTYSQGLRRISNCGPRIVGLGSSPWSRPTRTGTARAAWGLRWSVRAPKCSRAPTSRKGSSCARRACGFPSSCSGRSASAIWTACSSSTSRRRSPLRQQRARWPRPPPAGVRPRRPRPPGSDPGLRHDNLEHTLPEIAASPHLAIDAVYTHFATADEPEHPAFAQQRERFEKACETIATLGIRPTWRHAANSAALLRDERVWYDFVRPGLLLYGIVPPPLTSTLALRPALSLHSRIVHVKGMRPGEGTGYGLNTVVDRPSTIAVVPAGYADGLDRRLAGRSSMLVRGRRVPIVGSVCMDMTTIDVTGMDVSTGDEVVIVGEQREQSIGVREIAAAIGTIPYELLCRVGTRIERIYSPESLSHHEP